MLSRAIKRASRLAGIDRTVSDYTLRQSFSTQMLEAGRDMRTVRELLGQM